MLLQSFIVQLKKYSSQTNLQNFATWSNLNYEKMQENILLK